MEQTASSLIELGKYGTIGVMLALILLCAVTIWMLWKMACNHIEHSNQIFGENTKALTQLIDSQRSNTTALNRLIDKL